MDKYAAAQRKSIRADFQGAELPDISSRDQTAMRRKGDGRSGSINDRGIDVLHDQHFEHCIVQLKDEKEAADQYGRRKLLAFKDVLEEYDPEKRRSRELLWGAVGSGVSDAIDVAISAATKPIDFMVGVANDVAAVATDIANEATAIAGKAINAIKSVKDMAVELANKVADLPDMIWGAVYGVVPTSFKLKVSSLAEIEILQVQGFVDSLKCNANYSVCDMVAPSAPPDFEATVCSKEEDCMTDSARCVVADKDFCPALRDTVPIGTKWWKPGDPLDADGKPSRDEQDWSGLEEEGEQGDIWPGPADAAWAKPCLCDTLRKVSKEDGTEEKHPFHCNYASGMCNAGYTPFRPPINICADEGGLIYGSNGYNSLCYISPIWKCEGNGLLNSRINAGRVWGGVCRGRHCAEHSALRLGKTGIIGWRNTCLKRQRTSIHTHACVRWESIGPTLMLRPGKAP